MSEKYCPLSALKDSTKYGLRCDGNKCAWWVEDFILKDDKMVDDGCCAILMIVGGKQS